MSAFDLLLRQLRISLLRSPPVHRSFASTPCSRKLLLFRRSKQLAPRFLKPKQYSCNLVLEIGSWSYRPYRFIRWQIQTTFAWWSCSNLEFICLWIHVFYCPCQDVGSPGRAELIARQAIRALEPNVGLQSEDTAILAAARQWLGFGLDSPRNAPSVYFGTPWEQNS